MIEHRTTSLRAPRILTLAIVGTASLVLLVLQAASFATNACQEPNPSTVFCTSGANTYTCADQFTGPLCRTAIDMFERNQFPDGAVQSQNGTTKEAEADCSRSRDCVWDDDKESCSSAADFSPWNVEDKTVVGDNACPTNED